MKKRYLIAALLAAILLLSLFACNKTDDPQKTEKITLDLSAYKVVRPEKASARLRTAAIEVRRSLYAFNADAAIEEDWLPPDTAPDDAAFEILIGATNRPQSAEALNAAGENGSAQYVIAVIGNKIVINGTNEDAVILGAEYFINSIIPTAAEGGKLELDAGYRHMSDPLAVANVVEGGKCTYTVVYREGLDSTAKASDTSDRMDYVVFKANEIREMFASHLGEKPAISDDWVKPGTDTSAMREILVGSVDRAEYGEFLSTLAYNEYGYTVKGSKIIIAGWSDTDVGLAADMFLKNIDGLIGSDASTISLIDGSRYVAKVAAERYTDFPAYTGGNLAGLYDAGYGNLEFYYTDTTPEEYRAYISMLDGKGFVRHMENTIGSNLYTTLTSSDGMLHAYYIACEKAVRIVTAPKGGYTLPRFEPEKVTKITEPKMTQMSLDYAAGNFGMCYIFTLEDGSFVIVDGGGTKGNDTAKLYKLLGTLNERPDGKIVIAGWILTHEHWDHFSVFYQFCRDYGSKVTIEGFYFNTAAESSVYNSTNPNYYIKPKLDEAMQSAGIDKKYVIHSGQKYYIRNMALTCLYTQEDSYPNIIHYFNETSMVTLAELGGQRIMILGDSNDKASDRMYRRYADAKVKNADGTETDFLKCDIMQVAHHGYDGVRLNLYAKIKAPLAFWPTSEVEQKKQSSGSTSTYYYEADNYIANTLKALCLDAQKTHTVTLPFKVGDTVIDRD